MFIAGKHLPGAASTCLRADMQVRTVVSVLLQEYMQEIRRNPVEILDLDVGYVRL